MLRQRLLDRLVLIPSRHPLDAGTQVPFFITTVVGRLQIFRQSYPGQGNAPPDQLIIKWPGNAGRAENSTDHPAIAWPERHSEVWTINPHGYGQSDGQASLNHVAAMAQSVLDHARQQYPELPLLLFGNSIGCVTTLYQATLAQQASKCLGIVLRNPPPLRALIQDHYHRWYYGPATRWLTTWDSQVTDSLHQASRCRLPMVMMQAECDTIVPANFQDQVFDAYAGPKRKWVLPGADHHQMPEDEQWTDWLTQLRWLTDRDHTSTT